MKKTLLLVMFCVTFHAFAQTFDASFKPLITSLGGTKTGLLLNNGKYIIAGTFTKVDTENHGGIIKFNSDGTIDQTFITGTGFTGEIHSLVEQADGKILVTGMISSYNGTPLNSMVVRLNTDGSLDNTFPSQIIYKQAGSKIHIRMLADGKTMIVGPVSFVNGENINEDIIRLNNDGSLDTTFDAPKFSGSIMDFDLQTDGKIVVGGVFTTLEMPTGGTASVSRIARINADGSYDNTFTIGTGFDEWVFAVKVVSANLILIGGNFKKYNETVINGFVALDGTGSIDNSFSASGQLTSGSVRSIATQSDGGILLAGYLHNYAGSDIKELIRLSSTGVLDNTFNEVGTGPDYGLEFISINSGNEILILGENMKSYNGLNRHGVAILNDDGTLKSTTLSSFYIPDGVNTIQQQGTDKILVSHNGGFLNGEASDGFDRINLDGTIDNSFVNGNVNNQIRSVIIDNADNIVIGGVFTSYSSTPVGRIARLDNNGNLDATFDANTGTGFNSGVIVLTEQPDGKILVGGVFTEFNGTPIRCVARLNNNGTLDNSFNVANGFSANTEIIFINVIKVLSTGKIIVGGQFNSFDGKAVQSLIRLNADGSYDETFKIGSGANDWVYDVEELADGKLLVGGFFDQINNTSARYCVRLNSDGSLDASYPDLDISAIYAFGRQDNGKILVHSSNSGLIRLDAEGLRDNNFNTVAINSTVYKIVTIGKNIFLSGMFTTIADNVVTGLGNVILPPDPEKPANVDLSVINKNHVRIFWSDNNTSETGYTIERSISNANTFTLLKELASNTTSYDDNEVAPNTTYYYRVKARGMDKDSDYAPMVAISYDDGMWKLKTEYNGSARTDATSFAIDGKGYLGLGWAGAQTLNMGKYDPATNSWSAIAAYGGSIRAGAAGFTIGSKAYVGTGEGFDLENDLWEYDPSNNAWSAKTDFGGTPRMEAVGFAVGNKGYIGLGTDASGRRNDIWEYDPDANTWIEKASFPGAARKGAVAFVINGAAYVGTGSSATGNTKDFWKFDPVGNTWTAIADFPGAARRYAVAFALNGKGYVGTGESTSEHKDFWEYDPASNIWRQVASFGGSARFAATAFATSSNGYVGTGFGGANLKDFWEFSMISVPETPPAPTQLTATTFSSWQINLAWDYPSADPTKEFLIERSVGNESNYTSLISLSGTTFTYEDTGLEPATQYYYRIKVVTPSIGNSPFSPSTNATTWPMAPTAPSQLVESNVSFNTVTLEWTDNSSNETSFKIERSVNTDGNFTEVGSVNANVTTYTDESVAGLTSYYYRVSARNAGGNSGYSNTLNVMTPEPPIKAPSHLAAIANSATRVSLTWWDHSDNETAFRIYRSLHDADEFSIINTTAANVSSYVDNSVEENTSYDYKVSATDGNIESILSYVATVTTPLGLPAAPTNLTAILSENGDEIALTWTVNSTNTADFVIERAVNNDSDYAQLGISTTPSFLDNSFGNVSKTYYRVMARNAAGNSTYSNVASVIITDIEDETSDGGITISPNPTVDHLIIRINRPDTGKGSVQLIDLRGKVLYAQTFHKRSEELIHYINISKPATGLLLVKVSLNNTTLTRKVIIK